MKAAIIVFPGSNCDRDAASALTRLTGAPPSMVWHGAAELPPVDLIVLPGGFSHGDYLRSGAMAAKAPIMQAVKGHAARGGWVLGICNGFQILCEAGLLPGALMRNASLRFICRTVPLAVVSSENGLTRRLPPRIALPVAHMDGNYSASAETLDMLEGEGQVLLRYEDNPNGSARDIAGICAAGGRVMGLMPHPERAVEPLHGNEDGAGMLASLQEAIG